MDNFRSLRSSEEVWNTFKQETTSAEFATTELVWEIYECRSHASLDRMQMLADSLGEKIPFKGLNANDVSWEVLHATLLTLRVNPSFHDSEIRHVKLSTISFLQLNSKTIQN